MWVEPVPNAGTCITAIPATGHTSIATAPDICDVLDNHARVLPANEANMSHDFRDDLKAPWIACAGCWSLEPITFERFGAVTVLCEECGRRWDLSRGSAEATASEAAPAAPTSRQHAHLRLVTPNLGRF